MLTGGIILGLYITAANPTVAGEVSEYLPRRNRAKKEVLGEYDYVLVLNGWAPVGRYREIISPARSRHAVYQVQTSFNIEMGPLSVDVKEGGMYAANGAVRFIDVIEEESGNPVVGGENIKIRRMAYQEGRWSYESLSSDGQESHADRIDSSSHWGELSSLMLASRLLDPGTQGSFGLSEVVLDENGELQTSPITVTVGSPERYGLRGEDLAVSRVRIERYSGNLDVLVSKEGGVVRVEHPPSDGVAMHLVSCRGEECEHLMRPELTGPLSILRTLFEVRAGKEKPEVLEDLVDWEAFAIDCGVANPSLPEASRRLSMTRRLVGRDIFPERMIYPTLATFIIRESGDQAAVYDKQGQNRLFRFIRSEEGWRLVALS